MNSRSLSCLALLLPALVLAFTSCASSPAAEQGPAEVAVPKSSATDPSVTPTEGPLATFVPDEFPSAQDIPWGNTLEVLWLPQPTEVLAGVEPSSVEEGSAYLKIEADLPRVAAQVSQRQFTNFETYSEIDVPLGDLVTSASISPSPDATAEIAGKVIETTFQGVKYTLTVTTDPGAADFTIVMVKWEPTPLLPAAPLSPTLTQESQS